MLEYQCSSFHGNESSNLSLHRIHFRDYKARPSADDVFDLVGAGVLASIGWVVLGTVALAKNLLETSKEQQDLSLGMTDESQNSLRFSSNRDGPNDYYLATNQHFAQRGPGFNGLSNYWMGLATSCCIPIMVNIIVLAKRYHTMRKQYLAGLDDTPSFTEDVDPQFLPKLIKGTLENYKLFKNKFVYKNKYISENPTFKALIQQLDKLIESDLKDLYNSLLKNGATRSQLNQLYQEVKAIKEGIKFTLGYDYEKLHILKQLTRDTNIAEKIMALANEDSPVFSKRIGDHLRIRPAYYQDNRKKDVPIRFSEVSAKLQQIHLEVLPETQSKKNKGGFGLTI